MNMNNMQYLQAIALYRIHGYSNMSSDSETVVKSFIYSGNFVLMYSK